MAPGPASAASRLTIRSIAPDPREAAIERAAAAHGVVLCGVRVADVAVVQGALTECEQAGLANFLADPLLETATWDPPCDEAGSGPAYEIAYQPGVTDAAAAALRRAAEQLGLHVERTAYLRRVEFPAGTDHASCEVLLRRVIANPVIEHWSAGVMAPALPSRDAATPGIVAIPVRHLDDEGLTALSRDRAMALDVAEMRAIRDHFVAMRREPSDVELETLAQTWSEHCAHATFRAAVTVEGSGEGSAPATPSTPLLQQLRDCTAAIAAPFVRSAFVGDAGIVAFHEGETLALKAETHNHPSAIEPFGGANTGVGGVIRDVLGAGHRPMAITDVLCFGPPDTPAAQVPEGTLHPRRVIDGVIAGVADYGNKIGLPTVAGAVLYDAGFTTNPLVFCGCVGVADERPAPPGPAPGDRVVVLGGATGRDGIRGATFSSAAMDASTGEVAGASVQIGDPVTEKLLIDVLDGAASLYSAITDCGAGGLSSAVGEMADGIGADVELAALPLKYPGLAPWEVWLSEAQERMVLAVPPHHLPELVERCARRRLGVTDIGEFTGTRRLVVRHHGAAVLDLDTTFLHDGRPQRHLTARRPAPARTPAGRCVGDVGSTLLALLTHPNIASKIDVVQRYDHQVGGTTVVRPLVGCADRGHADGVVLARPTSRHGIAIGHGVNPWYGLHDPEAMAEAVVDEAIRNVVAVGADPDRVALLDNFSWGDPRDRDTLGQLVAAVTGCCTAATAHRAPFVSGKDSLNNTYADATGRRHAVPPTLVITAVGHVPDADGCVTPELHEPGNHLVVVGPTGVDFAGSHLDLLDGSHRRPGPGAGSVPRPDAGAPARYRALHAAIVDGLVVACHDVSEGGLAVAIAEMCIASGFGARIDTLPHDDVAVALFSESAGRFVLEVRPGDVAALARRLTPCTTLGRITAQPVLELAGSARLEVAALTAAFHGGRP